MKKIGIFLVFILLLSSCSITQQTYSFEHHGTESIKTDSNFKYVTRNVLGKAKTTYQVSSYRNYKQQIAPDGLLSEAKSRLPVLKDNQAFANFSIDVIETRHGSPSPAGINTKELTIEVVLSADIIEYY